MESGEGPLEVLQGLVTRLHLEIGKFSQRTDPGKSRPGPERLSRISFRKRMWPSALRNACDHTLVRFGVARRRLINL